MGRKSYEPFRAAAARKYDGIARWVRHSPEKGKEMSAASLTSHSRLRAAFVLGAALLITFSVPFAKSQAGELRARGSSAQLGFKSNGGGTSHDFQCGSKSTPACDDAFAAKCKEAGGTLNDTWFGKNCSTPGGW